MKSREIVIQKIHLESFLSVLMDAFEEGADFIDIAIFPDDRQDLIQILVREEYINTEPHTDITKDKLNDLLNG